MMQVQRLRTEEALPPRAASSASSYHTTLDHFPPTTTTTGASVESLTSELSDASTQSPSTPKIVYVESEIIGYDTIKRRREGTALVIEHPTLVNFVPTSDIQTAVRVLPDCVIIDTILPPTATLRANYDNYLATKPQGAHIDRSEVAAGEFDAKDLLEKHKKEVYRTLEAKLTENYDPTGSIKGEIYTTLTELTRFPDPKGTNKSQYTEGQCPCICCEMGCDRPLEPYTATPSTPVLSTSVASPTLTNTMHARSASVPQGERSFLEMTEASDSMKDTKDHIGRSKHRFGFLTFGRFGKSRSSADIAAQGDPKGKRASLPAPAPQIPEPVTDPVVPPKPSRSRSFSDLVRRRRKKHQASTPSEAVPPLSIAASTIAPDGARASQSMDAEALGRSNRSPSQTNLARGAGRYSLDATRVDTPWENPQPPPRRSSKTYAIVGRKPVPSLNTSSSSNSLDKRGGNATLPRSGRSQYEFGQIVEEDETGEAGSLTRRQSALMSSFEPVSNEESHVNHPGKSEDGGQAWAFKSVKSDRSAQPNNMPMPAKPLGVGEERRTQIGVAL